MPHNHKQTVAHGLKVKGGAKAGYMTPQHNQRVACGLNVKTNVKAGVMELQHNQTMARGLKVKTDIKAGGGTVGPGRPGDGNPPGLTSKP